MEYLVGIDDTDNKETRGTGFRARELAQFLTEKHIATVKGITRHQLFVHKDIPFTSHNSSACLQVECEQLTELTEFCRNYLLETAAIGSDVGLCIAQYNSIPDEVVNWGKRAKYEILYMNKAIELAHKYGIYREGLTGEKIGIIGALAGVGLRKSGNDGRFILLQNTDLRSLGGIVNLSELIRDTDIDSAQSIDNQEICFGYISLGDWVRPALINHKITLIVEPTNHTNYEWQIAGKDLIRQLTN